jgi:hypothetical protein
MGRNNQHEVVRDTSLTLAHILKTNLPAHLDNKPVDVVFDLPDEKTVDAAQKAGKLLLSVFLIDAQRSRDFQTNEQPVIREEDEEGNVVEFRLAPPTAIRPRYLITPWTKESLEGQVVQGLIMQLFFDHSNFLEEDLQGDSIAVDDRCAINLDESMKMDELLHVWQAMQRPFRPSLVYTVSAKLESGKRIAIRRVKERVLGYKKLEG